MRNTRPNELRSAAVTSKKIRDAAPVTKPGPVSGSRGGKPASVTNDETSRRGAGMPMGGKGREVPCWAMYDKDKRKTSSGGGGSASSGNKVGNGRAWGRKK